MPHRRLSLIQSKSGKVTQVRDFFSFLFVFLFLSFFFIKKMFIFYFLIERKQKPWGWYANSKLGSGLPWGSRTFYNHTNSFHLLLPVLVASSKEKRPRVSEESIDQSLYICISWSNRTWPIYFTSETESESKREGKKERAEKEGKQRYLKEEDGLSNVARSPQIRNRLHHALQKGQWRPKTQVQTSLFLHSDPHHHPTTIAHHTATQPAHCCCRIRSKGAFRRGMQLSERHLRCLRPVDCGGQWWVPGDQR